jgi:hypothetical protein
MQLEQIQVTDEMRAKAIMSILAKAKAARPG